MTIHDPKGKVQKTEKMAVIFDGHSHIERRVYADENGIEYVKINFGFFNLNWCRCHFVSVDVYF